MDWIDDISKAWQHEYPEFDTRAMPPLIRLARLSILIESFQHEVLEPFELAPSDYSVLAALRRAGKPYSLNPSQLYTRLQRSSGGMTKILKRLEDQKLVRRADNPDDRRGSLISLTRHGLTTQDRVFSAFMTASQDLLGPLSSKDNSDADRSLRKLLHAFESHRQS
jgi:DNA-binding MarR family transcriptional regulator